MLSFYLAFLYANRPYYDHDRILCMSQYLFSVQARNRLEQKGLLKRFSLNCVGDQDTMEDIRAEKAANFEKLKNKRGTKQWDEYFLRYNPTTDKKKNKHKHKTRKRKKRKKKKKTKKRGLFLWAK